MAVPVFVRANFATTLAVAPRAIVPDSINVDPDRRTRVTRNRGDGASPDGTNTGGRVSTALVEPNLPGSTISVAAFARSAFPASSSSQTRTIRSPAGTSSDSTRATPCPATD